MFSLALGYPKSVVLQQPLEDVDVPVAVDVPAADEIPVVGHGTLPPIGVTVLCPVLGNGLRPPLPSSVDPKGTPTRPMPDREPLPGDEADAAGLEDAVVPSAHVPEVVPDMPVLSNRAVGADVPPVAPLVPAIEVPGLEFPELGIVGCADAPTLEHVPVVMEPRADVPAAVGLTPGVASSVAPRGTPVAPTDAPGPIPSGEVKPSGTGAPVPTVPWANALLQPRRTDTVVVTNERLIRCHPPIELDKPAGAQYSQSPMDAKGGAVMRTAFHVRRPTLRSIQLTSRRR
jgi:hypothetical protein